MHIAAPFSSEAFLSAKSYTCRPEIKTCLNS